MADSELEVILKMAQKINPQIESGLKLEIDLEKIAPTAGKNIRVRSGAISG